MELWKDVIGYEGLYQVSNKGNVRSLQRINCYGRTVPAKVRKICINKKNGYAYVNLSKYGKRKNIALHRLVAFAFVDNPNGYETVNHKDENKLNNTSDNLEWMSLADNLRYGTHDERARKNRPDMSGKNHFNYGLRGSRAKTHKGRVYAISKKDPSIRLEFDTAATASRELNLSSGQLCDAINGKAKSCGGYYWGRINE